MKEKLYIVVRVLAGLGIVLAIYLLWQQFARPDFQPCNINSSVNCDAIITGEVSKTLGIPTPLIGLIGYVIVLIASWLKKPKLLLGMATFGLAFCGWIGYREIFQLHVLCPVCIICQADMLTVFILALVVNFKKTETVSQ